jgi:hypothetical protein
LAHVEEIGEGALDLKWGGSGRACVEGGNWDGIRGSGYCLEEVLSKEVAMQGVRTMGDEIIGGQAVGTEKSYVSKVGLGRQWSDVEREGWGESSVGVPDMGEQEVMRLEGVRGEEQATGSDVDEMVGAF